MYESDGFINESSDKKLSRRTFLSQAGRYILLFFIGWYTGGAVFKATSPRDWWIDYRNSDYYGV